MKNIAIFLYDYSLLGGVQKVTSNLVNAFYHEGLPIKCIISCHDSGVISYPYPKDVKIYKIGDDINRIVDILKEENIGNFILQVEKPTLCNQIVKIAKVQCNNIYPVLHSSPKYWTRKYYSIKDYLVFPWHILQLIKMIVYWRPVHKQIFNQWAKDFGIICVSHSASKELKNIVKGNSKKIDYIYNFHRPSTFKEIVNKNNTIVYAGRLSYEKRPFLMLKVWKKLYKENKDWQFEILGDGPLLIPMKKYIQDYKLKNVELRGNVNNVEEFLHKSKITLLFSKYEGLPTVLLEAIFNNNSIVACQSDGGTKDIVCEGVNGFVCPPKVKILSTKLQELMSKDGKLAMTMGERDLNIIGCFSNTEIINKWKRILK